MIFIYQSLQECNPAGQLWIPGLGKLEIPFLIETASWDALKKGAVREEVRSVSAIPIHPVVAYIMILDLDAWQKKSENKK